MVLQIILLSPLWHKDSNVFGFEIGQWEGGKKLDTNKLIYVDLNIDRYTTSKASETNWIFLKNS